MDKIGRLLSRQSGGNTCLMMMFNCSTSARVGECVDFKIAGICFELSILLFSIREWRGFKEIWEHND